jgi:hypothetical protein
LSGFNDLGWSKAVLGQTEGGLGQVSGVHAKPDSPAGGFAHRRPLSKAERGFNIIRAMH